MLQVLGVEGFVPNQRQDPPGSAHNNVGAVVLQGLLILLDRDPTKENCDLDILKVL